MSELDNPLTVDVFYGRSLRYCTSVNETLHTGTHLENQNILGMGINVL